MASPRIGQTQQQVAARLGRQLGIRFGPGYPIGVGGLPDGLADMGLERYVALEFELAQSHPSTNVLKYWPWLERSGRRLVLVHAIAPDARKRRGPRTALTIWLATRMERSLRGRFRYCRVELGSEGEDEHLQRARDAIARIRLDEPQP